MKNRFLIVSFFFSIICYSQTGSISGKILDTKDHSELIGVNISFGVNQGASTDINGEYNLILDPGTYSIKFQYIGYEEVSIDITINSGDIQKKDI